MTAVVHPLPVRPAGTGAGVRAPRPARPQARRRRPGAVELRRRRAVAALVALVLLGGGSALGGLVGAPLTSPGQAPAERFLPVAETSYVVRPGDTLWEIARALQPSGDVRPLVQRLAEARGAAPLRAGERLVLPPG
ncbi:MAG TPA: LysM peptidoglycan-binding domain-containing protein [Acidimicrobiales bacterium]|nr:LysM peptidoglycan-binding domain-containing protein [Acidimicrobiales bacterium]